MTSRSGICGAGAPAREEAETKSTVVRNVGIIANFLKVVLSVLQEIFDESAYRRFLMRGNLASSAASYAAFWSEQEKSRARQPRCC
jgi:hypothetical protein